MEEQITTCRSGHGLLLFLDETKNKIKRELYRGPVFKAAETSCRETVAEDGTDSSYKTVQQCKKACHQTSSQSQNFL